MNIQTFFGNFDIVDFFIRTLINLTAISIVARFLYYPKYKNKEFLFTFGLFNFVIYLLCLLLSSASIEMGFAFGLFAVFSIIRYRTVTIPVREMGYFFVSVAIGIVNALFVYNGFPLSLIIVNLIFVGIIMALDSKVSLMHENYKFIIYDQIHLIHENKRTELIEDLYLKIGIKFHKIEVNKIDFFKETARLKAFYFSERAESYSNSEGDDD